MKPILIPVALALTVLAPLAAHAEENYVGLNVGQSKQSPKWASHTDATDTSFKLYGGHKFNRTFGVEAGWVAHGESETRWGDFGNHTTKASSLYLAGTATLPLSGQFALTGKLGIADNRVKFSGPFGSGSTATNTHAMAGVGASYAFTPSISGVIEYEHFGRIIEGDSSAKVHSLSAGLRTSF